MTPNYQIRRSSRAKLARIIVSCDTIEVVAPPQMSKQHIAQFVKSKQVWITQAQLKVRAKSAAIKSLAPDIYHQGALVPFQGEHYPLSIKSSAQKRITVNFDTCFEVTMPCSLPEEDHHHLIKAALSTWMKQFASKQIAAHVLQHGQRFQLIPESIRVKTQKSRWGSCSSRNAININWLLMLAPPVILEYVVVHELCHIKEKNHSAAFWALVAEHMPDYQQHRNWLKQHGASLMQGL